MTGGRPLGRDTRVRLVLNLGLALVSGALTFALIEVAYRAVLFGHAPAFASLRVARKYADPYSEDDYWKLSYRLGEWEARPFARRAHPVLGWVGAFSRGNYLHRDASRIAGRRPVLLYGDSYAACVRGVRCFQALLNEDEEFSQGHYLLNYGVGGYGVDQIYLLLKNSIARYDDPFVIMSLLTKDLDRSVLSVRHGQKPRFRLDGDALVLDSPPILPDPHEFHATHPPEIRSYVYRLWLFGNFPPVGLASWLRENRRKTEAKIALNEKILREIVVELRRRELDFGFVVFHPAVTGNPKLDARTDWRETFLRRFLEDNEVAYIWSKETAARQSKVKHPRLADFMTDNNHPTTFFNELLANEMKAMVLRRGR
jgi:hypothetical protein